MYSEPHMRDTTIYTESLQAPTDAHTHAYTR